jgi:hypothetical protein
MEFVGENRPVQRATQNVRFDSSLTFATVLAVLLNQLLRLGEKQTGQTEPFRIVSLGDGHDGLFRKVFDRPELINQRPAPLQWRYAG